MWWPLIVSKNIRPQTTSPRSPGLSYKIRLVQKTAKAERGPQPCLLKQCGAEMHAKFNFPTVKINGANSQFAHADPGNASDDKNQTVATPNPTRPLSCYLPPILPRKLPHYTCSGSEQKNIWRRLPVGPNTQVGILKKKVFDCLFSPEDRTSHMKQAQTISIAGLIWWAYHTCCLLLDIWC